MKLTIYINTIESDRVNFLLDQMSMLLSYKYDHKINCMITYIGDKLPVIHSIGNNIKLNWINPIMALKEFEYPINRTTKALIYKLDNSNPEIRMFIDDDFVIRDYIRAYNTIHMALDKFTVFPHLNYIKFSTQITGSELAVSDKLSWISTSNGMMLRNHNKPLIPEDCLDDDYLLDDLLMVLSSLEPGIKNQVIQFNNVGWENTGMTRTFKNNSWDSGRKLGHNMINYIQDLLDIELKSDDFNEVNVNLIKGALHKLYLINI